MYLVRIRARTYLTVRCLLSLNIGGNIKCEVFGTTVLPLDQYENDPMRAFIYNQLVESIPKRYPQMRGRTEQLLLQTGEHKTWQSYDWRDGDNPYSRDLEEFPPGEVRTINDILPYLATHVGKNSSYEFQAHLVLLLEDKERTQKAFERYQRKREALLQETPQQVSRGRGRGKKQPPLPPSRSPSPLLPRLPPRTKPTYAVKKEPVLKAKRIKAEPLPSPLPKQGPLTAPLKTPVCRTVSDEPIY